MDKTGIILLSHGSRLPEAQVTLQKIKNMVIAGITDNFLVESAALQFNQPDLPAAIQRVVDRGVKKIIIVPLFLYMGLHMQRDIPEILARERNKYPGVSIAMTEHIGADPRLLDLIMDRVRGASS
ncbi:cobalamin biosynthesis protein CbiX [Desulfallas sp. Bu1-1]|uniref:sirohydrochlorin chelatase n=1 Tax=Desulfallas sp. Bu1-1 TaxID=2787620 RepID=UPI0018A12158|nr:CbiX/SirB N-terminal domain-containing protein [Desulfallas sp. Bu1-1]MBF7083296.1 cobalamin biosynthesis protein CbiX [Desulfallas sp. Bu1-1]